MRLKAVKIPEEKSPEYPDSYEVYDMDSTVSVYDGEKDTIVPVLVFIGTKAKIDSYISAEQDIIEQSSVRLGQCIAIKESIESQSSASKP
jgi:hypothetical protein